MGKGKNRTEERKIACHYLCLFINSAGHISGLLTAVLSLRKELNPNE
jgi:hypothetical protein